ncbi:MULTISPECIES: peptidoglycan-binding domain-containing protein [Bacillus]|uniref:Peptidoglycan binding-like domain-containing protein n=1 Tax=Bacillus wiedmannii TaxID=1890302 RepID=A0A2B6RLH2_9BACI|nr:MULTISPECIES: peptidoglycan-binding domain-containing protein [Bacillus]MDF9664038.1 peptidoglycan-binding domain-containing protein [Bacillus wiedmannii]PGC10530.1 hypothetical protein COM08_30470 [Bacillus wiedmannii]PGD30196.1 hypothetical protein COM27_25480 [Bacillus wiedmannii]
MGSQGTEVRNLQTILTKFGFYFGIIDGFFGPKTNHSVRKFQENRGLLVDGIVGPITWCQLKKI